MRGPGRWLSTGGARARGRWFVVAASLIGWCGGLPFQNIALAAPLFSPSTRVVLFTPASSDPLVARLEAELAAVGIAVRRVPLPADSHLDDVISREIAAGASAAIRIIPRSRGTEVWTGDTTARVSSRRSIRPAASDAALSVIALRTVEFLRASLLGVRRREPAPDAAAGGAADEQVAAMPSLQGPGGGPRGEGVTPERNSSEEGTPIARPTSAGPATAARATTSMEAGVPRATELVAARPDEVPAARSADTSQGRPRQQSSEQSRAPSEAARIDEPTPPIRVGEPRPPSIERSRPGAERGWRHVDHFEIAVGPAVLASPGRIGPIGAIAAIGRGQVVGPIGVELMAVFPVMPARVGTAVGTEDIRAALFGAGATWRLTPAHRPWLTDVALGGSATLLRAVGSVVGTQSVAGTTASTVKITGYARLGAGYQMSSWLVGRIDAIAGVVASRTLIGPANSDTSWGPLFGGGVLALQANW